MLDEPQNTSNIKWIDNWIDVVPFLTSILAVVFGVENGNENLAKHFDNKDHFAYQKMLFTQAIRYTKVVFFTKNFAKNTSLFSG